MALDIQNYFNQSELWKEGIHVQLTGNRTGESIEMVHNGSLDRLPTKLNGWSYPGFGQFLINSTESDKSQRITNNKTYVLDQKINPGPGIIPYNSTFWYNKTAHALSAPFINIANNCVDHMGVRNEFGLCVCWLGQPLTYNWTATENITCISGKATIGGFLDLLQSSA